MRAIVRLIDGTASHHPNPLSRWPHQRIRKAACYALASAFALWGIALALVPATAANAADLKAIEEAARKEAPMTWYVSLYSQAVAEKAAAAFSQKFPGLKIIPVHSTTGGSFQRLSQDLKSNVAVASVFSTTGLGGSLPDPPTGQPACRVCPGECREAKCKRENGHRPRLCVSHGGGPTGDGLQQCEGEGGGRSEILAGPHRPEVEEAACAWPSGVQRVRCCVGRGHDEAGRVEIPLSPGMLYRSSTHAARSRRLSAVARWTLRRKYA